MHPCTPASPGPPSPGNSKSYPRRYFTPGALPLCPPGPPLLPWVESPSPILEGYLTQGPSLHQGPDMPLCPLRPSPAPLGGEPKSYPRRCFTPGALPLCPPGPPLLPWVESPSPILEGYLTQGPSLHQGPDMPLCPLRPSPAPLGGEPKSYPRRCFTPGALPALGARHAPLPPEALPSSPGSPEQNVPRVVSRGNREGACLQSCPGRPASGPWLSVIARTPSYTFLGCSGLLVDSCAARSSLAPGGGGSPLAGGVHHGGPHKICELGHTAPRGTAQGALSKKGPEGHINPIGCNGDFVFP